MNFQEYLQELADLSRPVKVAGLVRLSGLTPEQEEAFKAAWPTVEVRRRRRVLNDLLDLAEDNVDLDFAAVFLRAMTDEDATVRLTAVQGLWEYEGTDLIPRLLEMLEKDSDPRARAEAALSLGRFVLLAEYGRLRERHFQQVEAGLRRKVEDTSEADEVRGRALEAIAPYDGLWVQRAIAGAYESGSRGLKVSAIHAMGRSCQDRWLPLLLKELANEDPEIRYEAALACGSLEDKRAVPYLAPLLMDPDLEVKEAAISALGTIGGSQARDLLLDLAADPSPSTREAVRAALTEIDFADDPFSLRDRL